jgi:hypothetical protein
LEKTKRNEYFSMEFISGFWGRRWGIHAHLDANLANCFVDITVKIGWIIGKKSLSFDDAGDGGGGQADGAQDTSQFVEVGGGIGGFDQTAGEDADECDLFSTALDIGVFDSGEVTFFNATGIEAVLEGIHITDLTTGTAEGSGM